MTWWKPWTWKADPKWTVLSGLPMVQFRLTSLVGLDFLTYSLTAFVVIWLLTHPSTPVDHLILEVLGLWYALLGSMHGINYRAYRMKRNTAGDGNVTEDTGDTTGLTTEMPVLVTPKVEVQVQPQSALPNVAPRNTEPSD